MSPTSVEQIARPLAACRHRQAEDFRRQQHVVDDAAPFQQQRLLEHHADVARRIERLRGRADPHVAGLVGMQAGEDFQQRGLAAAGRADQRDQLAGLDVERRLRHREELGAAGAVDFLHAGEMDERFAHARLLDARVAHDEQALEAEHDAVEQPCRAA